jgi:hypothetical protein
MAFIKCEECGKDISTNAELCPDCGCANVQWDGSGLSDFTGDAMESFKTIIFRAGLIVITISIIFGVIFYLSK